MGRGQFPAGTNADDFQCFGPAATKDGEFDNVKICDMGCFKQDGVDSNKYYHAAIVQHKTSKQWYVYFEWGRTGANSPDFQFVECGDEAEAQEVFAKQLHSKNDKRGEWATIAGIKTLRAKAGKDCYLVRDLKDRATGLPDAKRISQNTGAKVATASKAATPTAKTLPSKPKADPQTLALMRDLNVATVQYTKGAMSDSSVPSQTAIDDARQILTEAQKRLVKVGDDVDDQQNDKDLKEFTNVLYSKIPKTKPIGAAVETWILSKNNILAWQNDLDAFESAGSVTAASDADPFDGMNIEMNWLDPKESDWLRRWAVGATKGRHGYGQMKIHNAWKIRKPSDEDRFLSCQTSIAKLNLTKGVERPLFPLARKELSPDLQAKYAMSNTHLLWHGSRSVNIASILRKSLLLPKQLVGVVITGQMYGQGVYIADDWAKSAGYTSLSGSYWSHGSGGVKGRNAFMFLVDIVLGRPFVAPGPSGYTSAPTGYHSVFGKAGHSGVQNNEFIIYKTEQHLLKYLIEFSV
jgi:hypothetical protein